MLQRPADSGPPINRWVWKNRLFLWWLLIVPLFCLLLYLYFPGLQVDPDLIAKDEAPLLYKVVNTAPLIFLYRLVALAAGLVLLLICFFFPVLRLSSEGVSWNQEIEEKLVDFAGQAAADEVAMLVEEENHRWQALQYWVHLEPNRVEMAMAFQELLFVLCEVFSGDDMVVQMVKDGRRYILAHPVYTFLARAAEEDTEPGRWIGAAFRLTGEEWGIRLETLRQGGYSPLDQAFLTSICAIFARIIGGAEAKALSPQLKGFVFVESNL